MTDTTIDLAHPALWASQFPEDLFAQLRARTPVFHQQLTDDVAKARSSFIAAASGLAPLQASFKPAVDEWSIVDNVEHLYWAEMGGINGMWKALASFKNGTPVFTGEAVHSRLKIEVIIEKTWKEKPAPRPRHK